MFNPLEDKPDLFSGIVEFGLGILFFPSIFYSLSSFLSNSQYGKSFCQKYKIGPTGIYDISNKMTSTTFAILSCSCGLYVLQRCGEDVLNERHYILENYLIFGVSYFFYDIGSMFLVYASESEEKGKRVDLSLYEALVFCMDRPVMIIHHLLVPLIGFPVMMHLRGGQGDCLLGCSFLIEASTPFVSLRVILVHLNMKDGLLYILNGLAMLVSFLCCRVLLFPYLYTWYASAMGLTLLEVILSVPWFYHACVLALVLPQLYWFSKMVRGCLKLVTSLANKDKHE